MAVWLQAKVPERGLGLRSRLNAGYVCDAQGGWDNICGDIYIGVMCWWTVTSAQRSGGRDYGWVFVLLCVILVLMLIVIVVVCLVRRAIATTYSGMSTYYTVFSSSSCTNNDNTMLFYKRSRRNAAGVTM